MSEVITSAHGTGGKSTFDLIEKYFRKHLAGPKLSPHDAAEFAPKKAKVLITTDAHVIEPIIFPGGDIGKLSVTGVINDLLTRGGHPQYISLGFILEQGLPLKDLEIVLRSLAEVLNEHQIELLCADTKVVPPREHRPAMMITSTLLGEPLNNDLLLSGPEVGDQILVTGPIGSHGLAVLQAREDLPFRTTVTSDCASLFSLLAPLIREGQEIHYMRDPTRGGVAGVLHELARQYSLGFELKESDLPMLPQVRAGLDLLGLDPLEVANEGVMLIFVPPKLGPQILTRLQSHPIGVHAKNVGVVVPFSRTPLVVHTNIGGRRNVIWPEALNLPRIC